MNHILAKAPAVAALFLVACAGSQKSQTPPQQAHNDTSQSEGAASKQAESESASADQEAKAQEAKAEKPAQPGQTLVVITSGLLYPTGGTEISEAAQPRLNEIATTLKTQPESSTIFVQGHTDDVGSADANLKLAAERAQGVAEYLEGQGVPKDRIVVRALGEQLPISDKKTAEARAVNRRVDIMVQPAVGAAEQQGVEPDQGTPNKAPSQQSP
jgi:outer membrane protein OmpA-like peptidoglycan-associated protein